VSVKGKWTVRDGLSLEKAIQQAQALHQQRLSAGYDQAALDRAARLGFANGAFEDSEEFYPETQASNTPSTSPSLVEKLDQRASA